MDHPTQKVTVHPVRVGIAKEKSMAFNLTRDGTLTLRPGQIEIEAKRAVNGVYGAAFGPLGILLSALFSVASSMPRNFRINPNQAKVCCAKNSGIAYILLQDGTRIGVLPRIPDKGFYSALQAAIGRPLEMVEKAPGAKRATRIILFLAGSLILLMLAMLIFLWVAGSKSGHQSSGLQH